MRSGGKGAGAEGVVPEPVDRWGGWQEADLGATGRFRLAVWQDAHWLVTPDGHPFVGVGIAHANRYPPPQAPGDTTFGRFGDSLEAFIADRAGWMQAAGFNAFSYTTPEHAGVAVPWIATLPLMPGFINVGPRGFDPFDAAWRASVDAVIARSLPALLEDRRVIGISLAYPVMASPHVVPAWMWERVGCQPTNLLRLLKALGPEAPGKRAYVGYLRDRYVTVDRYAAARGRKLVGRDFDDLLAVDLGEGESPWELHPDDAPFYSRFWQEAVAHALQVIRRLSADVVVFSPRVIGLRVFPDPWLEAWLAGVGRQVDAYLPELYACDPYREIVAHIGAVTGRPAFVADGMRPCEFNYGVDPAADETEAREYRRMLEALLASPWFLGGTVCEYRPRIPEFGWYTPEPGRARTGVRRADYSERDPLFATYQTVHHHKYRTRLALLGGAAR
jgi:hypothetical protein